ncbi:MAG: acyl carrier protein [[Clostridium] scindens]
MTEEGALTAIWSEVLGKDPDPDVSFFQQGGTSLRQLLY